ncbi:MAG: Crp/Fnr family transcriptional regulator [Clostridia bacterium]|nr:Crp/Fnr family transcriptional regulator [Clostridia bacterium]
MMKELLGCPVFAGLDESEIDKCLACGGARIVEYRRDDIIFAQQDTPRRLYILLSGSVAVCSDSAAGRRTIIASFQNAGELFGEVFLFLENHPYDHYAQALEAARLLELPREFLYHTCGENCAFHTRVISNMLSILAGKAYYLNQKLRLLSSATLRQKLAKVLLQARTPDGQVHLSMNRETLADFLGVARPSLSRELMKMQEDGLVRLDGRAIFLPDPEALQELL